MGTKSFISRRFHIIVDAFECDEKLISDGLFIEETIKEIAKMLGMRILEGPVVTNGVPENPGLTAFAIIDFSHISIHTFTDEKEFCLDIFSCKPFSYKQVIAFVKKRFHLKHDQIYKSTSRYDQLDIEYDKDSFSPKEYLKEYYTKLSPENKKILEWYNHAYEKLDGKKELLEIGGGPTLYQFISSAPKVESITVTDYLQSNLKQVEEWIENQKAFDWNKYVEYSLKLEGKDFKEKDIAARRDLMKQKIKRITPLDISVLHNELVNKFDIVQTNFCIEGATDDISEFKRSLTYVHSYLKKGGTLLMAAIEGALAYRVLGDYLPAIYLDGELAKKYLEDAGFKIEEMKKVEADDSDHSKYHGILFIKAIKSGD